MRVRLSALTLGVLAFMPARGWAEGIRPEPKILVSVWADTHRKLPQKSSAEPGPWRTARTPYLREILDAMSASSPVEEVVLMAAAQLGKSEAILNVLGYMMDHAPGPAMLVQPTVELAKRFSRQRVSPLIEETPRLRGKVADIKTRDAKGSMLSKEFMGGVLILTGANSAVGLRSMPARWLLLDEIDGYPSDVDGEGDPIGLAEARQRTFPRRKRLKVSTPTVLGRSAIEAAFEGSDQRRYFVPCPHCGEMQVLSFDRLTWTKFGLKPAEAVYLCIACEGRIEERHKTQMLSKGEWRATAESSDPRLRGYHLNGLYSPVGWLSWGDIAKAFVKVKKDPEKLRVWTNTVLGETWKDRGEAPEWERLYHRRVKGQPTPWLPLPAGVLFLTAGVDVQADRFVVEIVGWGREKRSWSIECGVLPGRTDDLGPSGPWGQLDALLARGFPHEGGAELRVDVLAVDSGYNTMTVYEWARRHPPNRVLAVKGQTGNYGSLVGVPFPVEITLRGQRPIHGYKAWPVTGGVAKTELYGWLRLSEPTDVETEVAPGWCAFPEHDEDYFKQLTAEQLMPRRNKKGFTTFQWELIPGRENHVLDARVYARAAATVAGMDRFQESDWRALERRVGGQA